MFVYICVSFCLCVYFCPTFPSLKLYSNPDQGLRRCSAKSSIISSLQKIAKTGSGSQTETQKHTQWTHTATQRPPHSHGLKINSYKHACISFFFYFHKQTHMQTLMSAVIKCSGCAVPCASFGPLGMCAHVLVLVVRRAGCHIITQGETVHSIRSNL